MYQGEESRSAEILPEIVNEIVNILKSAYGSQKDCWRNNLQTYRRLATVIARKIYIQLSTRHTDDLPTQFVREISRTTNTWGTKTGNQTFW